ncbi:MAG: carboxylesterase family protein [Steroidobacteraceae bacterium]
MLEKYMPASCKGVPCQMHNPGVVGHTMQSYSRIYPGLLALLVSALAWGLGGTPEAAAAQSPPVVTTAAGSIAGLPAQGVPDVALYRGIPFAAPPTGALRWREPQPPAQWAGVREPLAAVPACVQPVAGSHLPWTSEYMHQGAVSEDCLFLNVWAPKGNAGAPLPVLVYIYGGGFNEGSIAVSIYDGAALAHQGAVIVEMNYRVGVLGFLAHPDLTRESAHHASGNYGLLDQVAALHWVKDNIAAFGGDPKRVTVFGQSAGAMSVYLLTASPLAKGLFRSAIVQSGPGALAAFGVSSVKAMTQSREDLEKIGEKFSAAYGARSIAELRAVDALRLLSPPEGHGPPLRFGPDVDGWLLPEDAETIYAKHQQNDVPMIIGTTADEGSAFAGYSATRAIELRKLSIAGIDQVLGQRAAAGSGVAYAYYFKQAIPWPEHPEFGAFHSGELPYVFDNLRLLNRPWTQADRRLATVASAYWINFATTGNPNGKGTPKWMPYQPGSQTFMVFGKKIAERPLRMFE